MKYFGLENIDAAEEEFIPPSVLNGSKPSKRLWLHKHVQNILETYVMKKQSSEHAGIRAGVASESRPPQELSHARYVEENTDTRKPLTTMS